MIIYKKYFYTTVILKLHRNLVTFLILNFAFLLFTACPEPPEDIDCGPHQIEVNGECECEEGYHWNEDHTKCLMDTTSHNFVWEIDTLGGNGSYLMDVAIIDENNVWVGGDIQADGGPYGAAIWDGEQWSLKKLETETSNVRPRGIWAFSDNNIWFASGSIYHWDGNETTLEWLRDIGTGETVEKIWASSQSNIFFVGNEGTIVHYDGESFERMESGADIDLLDIWGTSENDVWVSGKDYNESVILHYDGSIWSKFYERDNTIDPYTMPEDEILLSIASVWRDPEIDTLIAVGSWGVFHASISNQGFARWVYPRRWDIPEGVAMGYPFRVRGRAYNDIFVVGQRNSILHFNGNTWHNYLDFYDPLDGAWLMGISFTENIAYFVGENIVMKAIRTE